MIRQFKYTDKQKGALLKSITVLIDTREKDNSHILKYFDDKKILYKTRALGQGDYSFFIPKNEELSIPRDLYYDKEVTIERKGSLEELSGNLSNERDRFEKELSLHKGKIFLLIENSNYHDIYNNNYKTQYNKKSFIGSLHSFGYKYDTPFIFIPDKNCSGVYIYCSFYYFMKNILY